MPVLEPGDKEPVSEVLDYVGVNGLNDGDASSTIQTTTVPQNVQNCKHNFLHVVQI